MTSDVDPADRYILDAFAKRFPGASLEVHDTPELAAEEALEVVVNGTVWRCEVGSDDDAWFFVNMTAMAHNADPYLFALANPHSPYVFRIDFPE